MICEIDLRPLEPYFFGAERSAVFGDWLPQMARRKSYYLRSAELPSQSALFGVLRYLGISSPDESFSIDENRIGGESFRLTADRPQKFGMIQRISPLVLKQICADGVDYLVPAPRNHRAVALKTAEDSAEFLPYRDLLPIKINGISRLLPGEADYSEKDKDNAQFFSLKTGRLKGKFFRTVERVGINRRFSGSDEGGFFRKACILLHPSVSFTYWADVAEDYFDFPGDGPLVRTVYMGQGHTPFTATITKVGCLPVNLDLLQSTAFSNDAFLYRFALSDLCFTESAEALRACCSLMLAVPQEYREFSTCYSRNNPASKARFRREQRLLRLFRAGSVFILRDEEQAKAFDCLLRESQPIQATIAGFNCVYPGGKLL